MIKNNRRVPGTLKREIKKEMKKISDECREAELGLKTSIDHWRYLASDDEILPESLHSAGNHLADSAESLLKFYHSPVI